MPPQITDTGGDFPPENEGGEDLRNLLPNTMSRYQPPPQPAMMPPPPSIGEEGGGGIEEALPDIMARRVADVQQGGENKQPRPPTFDRGYGGTQRIVNTDGGEGADEDSIDETRNEFMPFEGERKQPRPPTLDYNYGGTKRIVNTDGGESEGEQVSDDKRGRMERRPGPGGFEPPENERDDLGDPITKRPPLPPPPIFTPPPPPQIPPQQMLPPQIPPPQMPPPQIPPQQMPPPQPLFRKRPSIRPSVQSGPPPEPPPPDPFKQRAADMLARMNAAPAEVKKYTPVEAPPITPEPSQSRQEGGIIEELSQDETTSQILQIVAQALQSPNNPQSAEVIAGFRDAFGEEALMELVQLMSGGAMDETPVAPEMSPMMQRPPAAPAALPPVAPMNLGGLISGNGDAMADDIITMADGGTPGQQKVAISSGEYVVAGDVVSGLGSGNTGAGAEVLDQLQEDVRRSRTGSSRQPPPIDLSEVLPRTYGE